MHTITCTIHDVHVCTLRSVDHSWKAVRHSGHGRLHASNTLPLVALHVLHILLHAYMLARWTAQWQTPKPSEDNHIMRLSVATCKKTIPMRMRFSQDMQRSLHSFGAQTYLACNLG